MAKLKLLMAVMLAMAVTSANAAWRVVIDPWTTAQVAENTASQKLIEEQHNARLDSMRTKQQRIAQYTAAMEAIKELYMFSMQNINGFGEETKYYSEIFSLTVDILTDVPKVLEYMGKSPMKNYVLCLSEMSDVVIETEGLVADFVDIVNNGKIEIPENSALSNYFPRKGGRYSIGQGDGHNFLNRYERLTMANRIYSRLLEIKYKMDAMCMMCEYCNGINDVLMAIDVQSWAAYFTGKNIVEGLVNDWNTLGV